MKFEAIFAMSKDRGIGRQCKLPWNIPEEMAIFRRKTLGHRVIMGRRTFESIGAPLEGRHNFVLRANSSIARNFDVRDCKAGVDTFLDIYPFEDASEVSLALAAMVRFDNMHGFDMRNFVIGGKLIFELFLPLIDKVHLSVIDELYSKDVSLPSFEEMFRLAEETRFDKASVPFKHQVWERK